MERVKRRRRKTVRRVNNEVEHAGVIKIKRRRRKTVRRVNNEVEHAGVVRVKRRVEKPCGASTMKLSMQVW
jgi:DNA-binding transcriptional regulator YhcF (GntR family)